MDQVVSSTDITEHDDGAGAVPPLIVPPVARGGLPPAEGPDCILKLQEHDQLSCPPLVSSEKPGMALWREKLFAWMMRNAATPMEFFRLPTNRVVELGSQVEI
jgi:hypothetical protein